MIMAQMEVETNPRHVRRAAHELGWERAGPTTFRSGSI
jgi:hypothetical protein